MFVGIVKRELEWMGAISLVEIGASLLRTENMIVTSFLSNVDIAKILAVSNLLREIMASVAQTYL